VRHERSLAAALADHREDSDTFLKDPGPDSESVDFVRSVPISLLITFGFAFLCLFKNALFNLPQLQNVDLLANVVDVKL
jgi:hypothetical protein